MATNPNPAEVSQKSDDTPLQARACGRDGRDRAQPILHDPCFVIRAPLVILIVIVFLSLMHALLRIWEMGDRHDARAGASSVTSQDASGAPRGASGASTWMVL